MIFVFTLIVCSAAELPFMIVYSEKTPDRLVGEISDFITVTTDFDLLMKTMSTELLKSLDSYGLVGVFDMTYSVSYAHQLKSICSQHHLIYFSRSSGKGGEWVFDLHPSPLTQAKAIYALLQELGWKKYHLITSESDESRFIYRYLSTDPFVVISSEVDQEVFDLHIGREVKPTGNWKVVAITGSKGASKVVQALKNMRIYKERCGLIISSKGIAGDLDTGTIVVSEEGLEFSSSEEDYHINSIASALSVLYEISDKGRITDNEKLRRLLEQNTDDHVISNTFSIVNFRPDPQISGNITDKVHINSLVFPGNVTELNTSPPVIRISANLGSINFDGSFSILSVINSAGIAPMIDIINANSTLLSNFHLELYGTNCGYSRFNYEYVSECMKSHINDLGAFYIDTSVQTVGEGNIHIFRENGIHIPHTGIFYRIADLYDKEKFPELYITTARTLYIYSILPYIMNSFRWKEILLFFQDDEDEDLIDALMRNIEILEIKVQNKNLFVPVDYDSKISEAYKEAFEEVMSSKCRILVLFLYPQNLLLFIETLFDRGFRKGDLVFVLDTSLANVIDLESRYGHDKGKVLELVDGSLSLLNLEYTGEYGKDLQKQIADRIYPSSTAYSSFQIDSLLLGVYTIDLMLDIGRNYEDAEDMNYFMRQQLFTGCSGAVSIDSQGNGRNEIKFSLRNFYVVKEEEWVEEEAGYYEIGIMIPLQISKEIFWPGGSKEVPEDTREDPKCGIKQTDIQLSQNSINITLYGSIGFFVGVLGICFIVWFRYYRFEIERISRKRELMFEDGAEIATVFLEGLQFVCLDPSVSILSFLSRLLGINYFLEFRENLFWRFFYATGGVSIFWSSCIFCTMTLLDRKFPKKIKNFTRYIGLTFLPLFAKIGFIGILWALSRIFECKEGTSDFATDAFLKDDCNMRCWKGYHLVLSIITLFALVAYSVLSTISSTVYDEAMDHVSIKTNTFFSFSKSMFKIVVFLLFFGLSQEYSLLLVGIYCILFVLGTIFCLKCNSFNYVRLSMWQSLVSLGVCLHFLFSLLKEVLGFNWLGVVIWDLIVILGVAGTGFTFQFLYLPGYFYKRKGRDFNKLLKFAYTTRVKHNELTEHSLDYRRDLNDLEMILEIDSRKRQEIPRIAHIDK